MPVKYGTPDSYIVYQYNPETNRHEPCYTMKLTVNFDGGETYVRVNCPQPQKVTPDDFYKEILGE